MEPMAHKGLHILIILVASMLAFLSVLAYMRVGNRRFLFVCFAFLLFAGRELIIFSEVVLSYKLDFILPVIQAPFSHVLSLIILLLFSLGIFSKRVV
jgi:hypothetical protein